MKAAFAAVWKRLRELVVYPVPAEHRAGCARSIAYLNWQRATAISLVAVAMNLVSGLLPEIYYYRRGYWRVDGVHLTLTGLHGFMVAFGLGMFVVLLRARPASEAEAGPRHQRLAMFFCAVMLGTVTIFSVFEQSITGSISVYLLGVAAFATLFCSTARFSWWIFAATYVGLVAGMFWLQRDLSTFWHNVIVGLDAGAIFWVGSRLVHSLKSANYVQFATLAQQATELAQANRELDRAHQLKTELLALAAHDLRDPLNTITVSAHFLRTEFPGQPSVQTLVAHIADSSQHMASLIDNLITDAASGVGEITLERSPTDLPRLVADTINSHTTRASHKTIALHYATDDSALHAPRASVDPARFRQVVDNLVSNAVKYSPPGSNVWVTLAHDPADGYRLVVRDEGPGLTAEDQAQLFVKHQRLSARPTGGEPSTGLGLAIVKQLVQLHGGRVWAESAGAGRGASFIVTVP